MTSPFHWRPMRPGDIAAATAIAAEVHTAFHEDDAVYIERLALYPAGCRLLEREGAAVGYCLSHPWTAGSLPALNTLLGALPAAPSTYYIHDVALLPAARGSGAAGTVVAALTAHAADNGFSNLSLVAVNGSEGFWRRQGFHVVDAPELGAKLASYEAAARLMARPLG